MTPLCELHEYKARPKGSRTAWALAALALLSSTATAQEPPSAREQQKLVDAFRDLSKEKTGQSILATMGCKAFRAVDAKRMKQLEAVFEARLNPEAKK